MLAQGRGAEAVAVLKTAVTAHAEKAELRSALIEALVACGKADEALKEAEAGAALWPASPGAQIDLAEALSGRQRFGEAIDHFRRAIATGPGCLQAYTRLGMLLLGQNRHEEAAQVAREGLAINAFNPELRMVLGSALTGGPAVGEGIMQLELASAMKPDLVPALNNLSWIRATSPHEEFRNGAEAVGLAERACQLTDRKDPLLIGTLAAAYAEARQFEQAAAAAQEAAERASILGQTNLAERNLALGRRYKSHQPYREKD